MVTELLAVWGWRAEIGSNRRSRDFGGPNASNQRAGS